MSPLDPRLAHLISKLDRSTPMARVQADHIAEAIGTSPHLRGQLLVAVESKALERIEVAPTGGAYGHFDERARAIRLDPSLFRPNEPRVSVDGVTDVLGHEAMHALLKRDAHKHLDALNADAYNKLGTAPANGAVDVTGMVGEYIRRGRIEEAAAEIQGWNSLRSRIDGERPGPVAEDEVARRIARTSPCVYKDNETGLMRLDRDIQRMANQAIDIDPAGKQVEQMAICSFDRRGQVDESAATYRHHYGAAALSVILQHGLRQQEDNGTAPEIQIDLKALGLTAEGLRREGVNLGGDGRRAILADISDPSKMAYFAIDHQGRKQSRGAPDIAPEQQLDPRQQAHPDYALFKQTEAGVHRLDATIGRTPDASSEAMTASLFALAKERGFRSVDHVLLNNAGTEKQAGEIVFIVQGDLKHEGKLRAQMPTAEAVATPPEQSLERAQALPQVHHQVQDASQQEQQHGPRISR